MARDILTVLVSTVASESAFSAGNRVLDEQRSRLRRYIESSHMRERLDIRGSNDAR